jgi:hypothetical protein
MAAAFTERETTMALMGPHVLQCMEFGATGW